MWFQQKLSTYLHLYGIVDFEDLRIGGRTTENGMVEIDEEYSPRETAGKVFDQNENAN